MSQSGSIPIINEPSASDSPPATNNGGSSDLLAGPSYANAAGTTPTSSDGFPKVTVKPSADLIRLQLIPWSTVPMIKPVLSELVERRVKDNQVFKVGRQVNKEPQAGQPSQPVEIPNPLDVWFTSKVVSRTHAEFSIKDGQIFIRDVGSSSGTFLNKMRLSPTTKESKPYPIKEGDIVQFGVDYKGKPDDIYKSITVRVGFYDQSWVHEQRKKADPSKFRRALNTLLNSTNPKEENHKEENEPAECVICYEETGPFQALFVAPCSHIYHYKCVSAIIVQSAMFQCPLCRQVANLTASVSTENLNALCGDELEVAIGAKGDPVKLKQALEAAENAANAPPQNGNSLQVESPSGKKKKESRRSSFRNTISTIFGRKASSNSNAEAPASSPERPATGASAGSSPASSPPQVTAGDASSPSPTNQATQSDASPTNASAAVAPGIRIESAEADSGNPQYRASGTLQTPGQNTLSANNNIPRSTTVNTFEDGSYLTSDDQLAASSSPGPAPSLPTAQGQAH